MSDFWLTFTGAYFYWLRMVKAKGEPLTFGEWLDTTDKKTKRGFYGVKR